MLNKCNMIYATDIMSYRFWHYSKISYLVFVRTQKIDIARKWNSTYLKNTTLQKNEVYLRSLSWNIHDKNFMS